MADQWIEELGGLTGDVCVDTPGGPRRIDCIAAGESVLTVDGGAERVLWTGAIRVPGVHVVEIEGVSLSLASGHHLRAKGPMIELHFAAEAMLARAGDIAPLTPGLRTVHTLALGRHALIRAGGLMVETLFVTAAASHGIERRWGTRLALHKRTALPTLYPEEAAMWRELTRATPVSAAA